MKAKDRSECDLDVDHLKTGTIGIYTGQGTFVMDVQRSKAREMVLFGIAFVLTDRAIGICE